MTDPLDLALVYGSTRTGRFCDTVAAWAASRIARHEDLRTISVDPGERRFVGATHSALARRLDAADAFVVVVPEYNHSFPAPLKALIDATGSAWRAKPVGFVSYGGFSGGIRAIEQLRQVFAELHAVTLRDAVSFANAYDRFDGEGRLVEPAPAEAAMEVMLARIRWWATALGEARRVRPYDLAAA